MVRLKKQLILTPASFKTCPSTPCPRSNSCILAQAQASPRSPFTAAVCMGRPVLSAVWPETRTVPGMEHRALATCQTPRGLYDTNTDDTRQIMIHYTVY